MTEVVVERRGWHVGKEIPIATVLAILVMIGSNYATWRMFEQKVTSYMLYTDQQIVALNEKNASLKRDMREYVNEKTADRINAGEVRQMFVTKDTQIQALQDGQDKITAAVQVNNHLIQQLLRDLLPRVRNLPTQ